MPKILHPLGFGLLEVLISLFILSTGLLGLGALQAKVVASSHQSYLRSVAISQIGQMADRMRTNRTGVTLGAYDNLTGLPANPPQCETCTAAEIAVLDQLTWNTENMQRLPAGQGQVKKDNQSFLITMMWDQQKTGAVGTDCSGDPTIDLTCLTIRLIL